MSIGPLYDAGFYDGYEKGKAEQAERLEVAEKLFIGFQELIEKHFDGKLIQLEDAEAVLMEIDERIEAHFAKYGGTDKNIKENQNDVTGNNKKI